MSKLNKVKSRTTGFNPDFWEVTLSEEEWQKFTTEDQLGYESPEEVEVRHKRAEHAKALLPTIRAIMDEVLTSRQREFDDIFFIAWKLRRSVMFIVRDQINHFNSVGVICIQV